MSYWKNKSVVVTGGAGFLGGFIVGRLKATDARVVVAPRSRDYDLREREAARRLMSDTRPDVVIHLAAKVGGIGPNFKYPGTFFYENAIMGVELMEAARLTGVGKFVSVGTICSYPRMTPVPFKEDDLWNGYPDDAGAPYGMAKKMLIVQSRAYRQQYGFNSICLLPVNLYGPGDNFDLETSHVMPALIRKIAAAKEAGKDVTLWGTGSASREFVHIDDAARGILMATERYDKSEPVNIGTGREITIRALAELIARSMDFRGAIHWDATKPDGQPRRCLDVQRAKAEFGFTAEIPLEDGVKRLIDWYTAEFASAEKSARAV